MPLAAEPTLTIHGQRWFHDRVVDFATGADVPQNLPDHEAALRVRRFVEMPQRGYWLAGRHVR
jgi:hypothetical protein